MAESAKKLVHDCDNSVVTEGAMVASFAGEVVVAERIGVGVAAFADHPWLDVLLAHAEAEAQGDAKFAVRDLQDGEGWDGVEPGTCRASEEGAEPSLGMRVRGGDV